MLPSVSNLVEDADDRSFIHVRKCPNGGNRDITDLVVVNASNVNLFLAIGWFANEGTIRTSKNKTICTSINECIFGVSGIPLAHPTCERLVGHKVCVVSGRHPRVELGIDVPHGFTGVVTNALLGVAEKHRWVCITWFAAKWLCFPRGRLQL